MYSATYFTPHHYLIRVSSHGVTSIELLVVLAILGILAALATPSFLPLLELWRIRSAVDSMKSTLYLARSEAIKRGGQVGIQKNPQNTDGCKLAQTTQEWGCGWFVFSDSNGNGKWDAGEEIIHTTPPTNGIDVVISPAGNSFKLDRFGKINGANITSYRFSPNRTGISSPSTRSLCIAAGGRLKVIEDIPPCI